MYALIYLITVFYLIVSAETYCELDYTEPMPKEIKTFGSKYFLDEYSTSVQKNTDETAILYCYNGFNMYSDYYGKRSLLQNIVSVECDSNGYFNVIYNEELYVLKSISCMDNRTGSIFESYINLPNCKNYLTLVVGRHFNDYGSSKLIALCYDMDRLQLKYMAYTAYPQKRIDKTQIGQLNPLRLDIKVDSTKQLLKTASIINMDDFHTKYSQIIPKDTFQYASLIQDESLTNMISEYNNLISIIWLRILRTGNWRNWLNALHDATKNYHKFDIRVGVSGIAKLSHLCMNQTLNLDLDIDTSLPVPELIWAHVSEIVTNNLTTNDFVIVAHNNPFFAIDEKVQLCTNICNQVYWLKDNIFSKLQLNAAFGLVYCCRVEDVATKLDNFPLTITQADNTSVET